MKLRVSIAVACATAVCHIGLAQQAEQNINVLPIYYNEANDPNMPLDPEAFLKGDLFLQRQVEPTIAVSTRNPDHVIAFFNDYRAVDIPDDGGVGEAGASVSNTSTSVIAKVLDFFRGRKTQEVELPEQAALFPEAWVGGSRSYDGGITWSGFFVPGGPFDNSPASLASPVYGFEAGTDPVASAAPCGVTYVGWLAFTRGGSSMMVVSRYQDLNNLAGGDTWEYQGTAMLEVGNNASNGYFLDKPYLLVDPYRGPGSGCGHNIYVSYTTFNGLARDGKFKSKVTFARSTGDEFGFDPNFDVQKLNAPFQQNQGTWIAVDPRPGTPNTDGGGTVHIFWRHFFDPNAILTIKSTNYGATFPGNPKKVTGSWDLENFDQVGVSTIAALDAGFDPAELASFRSNAFPTAAISATGKIFVAWQERVDTTPGETLGYPMSGGYPRIVLTRSNDGGSTWTDVNGVEGSRRAVDISDRDTIVVPGSEPGALPAERWASHQVMPALSCGGDRCMLIYSESRGRYYSSSGGGEIVLDQSLTTTDWVNGIDRVMDLRAAFLDPATGDLLSTTQVSRYTLQPGADSDTTDAADVVPVMWPCSPDDGPGLALCERSLNRVNKPQSAAGTIAFIGDYNFAIPIQSYVPDGDGWRWAATASDLGFLDPAFRTIWADNRNLIPPQVPVGSPEWQRYQYYDAIELDENGQIINETCPVNWGAKNTDVMTAQVGAELTLSAPTTYKQAGPVTRAFPVRLTRGEAGSQHYYLAFASGTAGAFFSQTTVVDDNGQPFTNPVTDGYVEILGYSSATVVVYLDADVLDPVQVLVFEVSDPFADPPVIAPVPSAAITLNADPSNGPLQNPDIDNGETHDVEVSNPLAANPLAANPLAANPLAANPLAANPLAANPLAANYTLTDSVTWTVQPGDLSNSDSSYLALVNVDNPELYAQSAYAFQLLIWEQTSRGGLDSEACLPIQVPQAQLISNIYFDPGNVSLISNPLAANPLAANPLAANPLAANPLAANSTFTVAPADSGTTAPRQVQGAMTPTSAPVVISDDGTLKAPRAPEEVKITLLAYKLCRDEGDLPIPCAEETLFDPFTDPPSLTLLGLECDEPFVSIEVSCDYESPAPDLVIVEAPAELSAEPFSVRAGQTVTFPVEGWTLKNDVPLPEDPTDPRGTATPENGPMTHGVYLSTKDFIVNEDGSIDSSAVLLGCFQHLPKGVSFEAQEEKHFSPSVWGYNTPEECLAPGPLTSPDPGFEITIPSGTTPSVDLPLGVSYHLLIWADNDRQVSEQNDVHNTVAVPIEITVANVPPGNIQIEATVNANEGEPVTLTVTFDDEGDTGEGYTFVWDFGDGSGCDGRLEPENCGATEVHTYDDEGSYTVTVTVIDSGGLDGDGELNLVVANVAPTAADDTYSINEDGVLTVTGPGILDNDTDPADELTVAVLIAGPSSGSLSFGGDGSFTYTPTANFAGTDSFTYKANDGTTDSNVATVTITVNAVNDAPVAVNNTYLVDEDQTLSISALGVLGNDSDVESDSLTAVQVTGVSNGTLALSGDGSFTYTPNANFNGQDSFTYKANDGNDDSNVATVTITIGPANDAPVANAVVAATTEDNEVIGSFLATDIDSASLTYSIETSPANGAVVLGPGGGQFTYTPDLNSNGQDSFTYKANDGALDSNIASVTVNIQPVNDTPVAYDDTYIRTDGAFLNVDEPGVLGNDSDVDGDILTAAPGSVPTDGVLVLATDGSFTYTPNAGFFGSDSFTYVANDGIEDSNEATVAIGIPYLHIGLLDPWRPASPQPYSIKRGSAFPVRWQYADPATGLVVESSGSLPEVRLRGPVSCNGGNDDGTPEQILTPGNSTYQYDDGLDIHQLNVDTNHLQTNSCYNVYTASGLTQQLDGPFIFKLKR